MRRPGGCCAWTCRKTAPASRRKPKAAAVPPMPRRSCSGATPRGNCASSACAPAPCTATASTSRRCCSWPADGTSWHRRRCRLLRCPRGHRRCPPPVPRRYRPSIRRWSRLWRRHRAPDRRARSPCPTSSPTGWWSWKRRSTRTTKSIPPASANACCMCWTPQNNRAAWRPWRCSRSRRRCARPVSLAPVRPTCDPRWRRTRSRRATCGRPTASSCAGWPAGGSATMRTRTHRTRYAGCSPPAVPGGAAPSARRRMKARRVPAASDGS